MSGTIPITEPFEVSNPTTQAFPQIMPSPASIVFRSAGPRGGNVYTQWSQVVAATAAINGPRAVDVETTETIPVGTWDLGTGYSLVSASGLGELDAVGAVSLASPPASVDGMNLSADTQELFTLDGAGAAPWYISRSYVFSNGADAVIKAVNPVIIAENGTFFDAGSIRVPTGAIAEVHLRTGSAFATGAFVTGTDVFMNVYIEDATSLNEVLSSAPTFDPNAVGLVNNSGVTAYAWQGAISFYLAANSALTPAGSAWTIFFQGGGSAPLVSADLRTNPSSGWTGTWAGITPNAPVPTSTDGVNILPPKQFTLDACFVTCGATDVALFTTQVGGIVTLLRGATLSSGTGNKPVVEGPGTVIVQDGSRLANGGAPCVTAARVEAWDNAIIEAGAVGAAIPIVVKGVGTTIPASYGAAIQLVPGVLFAADGNPVTVGVTPTDPGCIYLDTSLGVLWTTDGSNAWHQVNAVVALIAFPLATLQSHGATNVLTGSLTATLPADTWVSLAELQVTQGLDGPGLTHVQCTMESNGDASNGTLLTVDANSTEAGAPLAGHYSVGATNPYPRRGGQAVTCHITLTGCNFGDLTAGSVSFRCLVQTNPDA